MTQEEKNPKPTNPLLRMISLLQTGRDALKLRFHDQITRRRTGHPVYELSEITPQLYVGGQHRKHGWDDMVEKGFTAIVNMREAWHDDVKDGVGGEHHLHLVTRDNTPPKLEDLERGAEFITSRIENGDKVYVHCGVGVGRAPTMAAAYFVTTGMTPDEALNKIKAVRPFIHLTPGQRRQLDAFAQHWEERQQQEIDESTEE